MNHEYAGYSQLSAEAHNNISFINCRYFVQCDDPPYLRLRGEHCPANYRYDRACALNMIEITLNATEKILQLCGHGTAVLANVRTEFDLMRSRLGLNDAG
jgi:hypothetical protein